MTNETNQCDKDCVMKNNWPLRILRSLHRKHHMIWKLNVLNK